MKNLLTVLVLMVSAVSFAVHPDDSPDVKDHPDVPRYPGSFIAGGNSHDFSSHDFPDGEGWHRVERRRELGNPIRVR